MKRSVLLLTIFLTITSTGHAKKSITQFVPSDSRFASAPAVTTYNVIDQQPFYTNGIDTRTNVGFNGVILTIDGADVDLNYEVSNDNVNWFIPYDNSSGTLASDNTVASAVTVSRWVVFTSRLTNFIRFYIDPDKSGSISLKYFMQEER